MVCWEHTIPTIAIYLCNLQIVSLIAEYFLQVTGLCEFSQEYFSFIENFIYKKGSLMQQTMETVLFNKMNALAITPLPPQEIDSLKDILNGKIDFNSNSILLLHKRVKTILVGGFMISAKGSQNSRSPFVLAKWRTSTTGAYTHRLTEIQYFVSCIVVSADKKEKQIVWVAIVKCLMEHQCKVWFGYPTQVWSSIYLLSRKIFYSYF